MKQNEKILVYVVTGLLFLILAVAVIFGKDGGAPNGSAPNGSAPNGSTPNGGPTERGTAGGNSGTDSNSGALPGLEEWVNQARQMDKANGAGQADPAPPVPGTNLAASVNLTPPAPATEIAMLLGKSQRDRNYRIVTVRSGDTLRELVLRWCGGIDAYWEQTLRLNEAGTSLQPGQAVVLPWVDDAEVLAALRDRQPKRAEPLLTEMPLTEMPLAGVQDAASRDGGAAVVPATTPPASVPVAFRSYTVKSGDMLWKIAEREVGARNAPGFIAQVRELNPQLDVDHLKVNQTIRLPATRPN